MRLFFHDMSIFCMRSYAKTIGTNDENGKRSQYCSKTATTEELQHHPKLMVHSS